MTTPLSPTVDTPPSRTLSRRPPRLFDKILRSARTRTGLIMMVTVILVAIIGPIVAPHSPSDIIGKPFSGSSSTHVIGTDYLGHDALSVFLYGGQSLIVMSILASILGVGAGAAVGIVGAYAGGPADTILMRVMDVILAFPTVVFVLLLVSMVGPSPALLVISVAVAHIPGTARVIRGAAQPVATREFILWARTIGLPARRILTGEILPNVVSPLMVELGLRLMWSVGALASLSFLGYGIQPPASDWGLMINQNRNGLSVQPFTVLMPILGIAIFTIGGNLFAEGVARIVARTEGGSNA